jgi:autotransporter adhesin
MADVKISALPAVTVPATTDVVPVVQGGVTKQETLAQLLSLGPWTSGAGTGSAKGGSGSTAAGNYSISYGTSCAAAGLNGIALGNLCSAGGADAVALGGGPIGGALASGDRSIAIGEEAAASNTFAIAIGKQTTASNAASVAIGEVCVASGPNATGIGYANTASGTYSSALGCYCNATATGSVALGLTATSARAGQLTHGCGVSNTQYCMITLGSQLNATTGNMLDGSSTELSLEATNHYSMRIRILGSKVGGTLSAVEVWELTIRTPGSVTTIDDATMVYQSPAGGFVTRGWAAAISAPGGLVLRIACNSGADNVRFAARVEWLEEYGL